MQDRKSRSSAYQYKYNETPWHDFYDEIFILQEVDEYKRERVLELRERLLQRVLLLSAELTPKQAAVFSLFMDGYNQIEIAKRLKVHQGTISATLLGSMWKKQHRFGGIVQKLKKLCEADKATQSILEELHEIGDPETL